MAFLSRLWAEEGIFVVVK
ncbi:phage late control D family protein [Escherichia coli]|nr:phage late control D family protein [Escherichia coli]